MSTIDNTGAEIINNATIETPELSQWVPSEDQKYFVFEGEYARARYDHFYGLNKGNKLEMFVINKKHYRDRMNDIIQVINYFLNFYDEEKDLFKSIMSVKFVIDQKPNLKINAFRRMVMQEIVTPSFVAKIKKMTNRLYTINIDTDEEGKYKSTPKITNEQAKLIIGVSFAIRCVLPLMIHFSDTNNNFVTKTDYIPAFDKVIMKIVRAFEKDDIEIFNTLCRFIKYRVDRYYSADIGICIKKKQLYGMTKELYLEEIIHEVILVKSLYKLEYFRSVVSFIDGVIFMYHKNYKIENFKCKPVEIESQEASNDDDEHLSHAEAIEMSVYRIDESNSIINEVNTKKVINSIRKRFNIEIPKEELEFYQSHIRISPVGKFFLEIFYNRFFHDSNAIENIPRDTTIELLIYMKKYLQLRGMTLVPQLCTARVRGRYNESTIKNAKFIEKITTSSVWNNIIQKRFTYIGELNPKEHPIIKRLSSFVNSTFEFVDYNGPDDGLVCEEINQDQIISEFSLLLSII